MFAKSPKPPKFATIHLTEDDVPVNQHLAADLKDLDALRRNGKAISVQNAESMYYDGHDGEQRTISMENTRGVDLNDIWNKAMSRLKAQKRSGATLTPTQIKEGGK